MVTTIKTSYNLEVIVGLASTMAKYVKYVGWNILNLIVMVSVICMCSIIGTSICFKGYGTSYGILYSNG